MKRHHAVWLFVSLISTGISSSTLADTNLWQAITASQTGIQLKQLDGKQPLRQFKLNKAGLNQRLLSSGGSGLTGRKFRVIDLPLPDGKSVRLKLEKSSVLPKALADKYPNIHTWKVQGIDQKISGRIDITPQGFHGMLMMPNGDRVFIDPDNNEDNIYRSISQKRNVHNQRRFSCGLKAESFTSPLRSFSRAIRNTANKSNADVSRRLADGLIKYRLALAATGEYTVLKGGSKAAALAAMVTTINRVNEITSRDLGIEFELVSNNDQIIYTNAATDPYRTNNDMHTLVDNINNIPDVIGEDNYDIGHVFKTGYSGVALVGVSCDDRDYYDGSNTYTGDVKAGGVTGSNNPQGDSFDIDFVAHELGHQLGATHTFNQCKGSPDYNNHAIIAQAAVEPGSGSTIMSYAGICGSNDNLQTNSDAMFHTVSISQIKDYTRNSVSCGTMTVTGNQNPTISAGQDKTIPANTPFVLKVVGSDADSSDVLSYSWDQTDSSSNVNLGADSGANPLFRTFLPSSSDTRYFPKLTNLFAGTASKGEKLPATNRTLNFSTVIRDNEGGLEADNITLTTINAGSAFAVTSHSQSKTISPGSTELITWNVAGTNMSPISCGSVDVSFINTLGQLQPVAEGIVNDGEASVVIPSDLVSMSDVRFMVKCSDNVFFAISSANLQLDGASLPVLSLNSPSVVEGDEGTTSLIFNLTLSTASQDAVSVDYVLSRDEQELEQGTLIIPANTTSDSFSYNFAADTEQESDETITLTLSDPVNALFNATGVQKTLTSNGTIIDDDGYPVLRVDSPSVNEGDSGTQNLTFTLSLSTVYEEAVTVDYQFSSGGEVVEQNVVTIPANTNDYQLSYQFQGDTLDESNEVITLNLSNPVNAVFNSDGSQDKLISTGTIIDDDEAETSSNPPPASGGGSMPIFILWLAGMLYLCRQSRCGYKE